MAERLVDEIIDSGTRLVIVLKQLNGGLRETTEGLAIVMGMLEASELDVQKRVKQAPEMLKLATHLSGISEILFEHQIYQAEYKMMIDKMVGYFLHG